MAHPDILLIVLDSVRIDRMSTYGHHLETTPTLDSFADHATVYENAITQAPWTLPSHVSMFTGLMPNEHGVTNWFRDQPNGLPSELETLPEQLSKLGYDTAGFSNNPWVGSLSGLDRGFDEFLEWDLEISSHTNELLHTTTDRIRSRLHTILGTANRQPLFLIKRRYFTSQLIERAQRWIELTANRDNPTFTFLNLMEAHSPYFPPRSIFRELGLNEPGSIEPRVLNTKLLAYVMGHGDIDPIRERVLEYYDSSLLYQDKKVAALLQSMRESDTYDDGLIIICSDHGKNLGEYDRSHHPPHYIRDVNTDVPLLVKEPHQSASRREKSPVELTRVYDLMLDGGGLSETLFSPDGFAFAEDFYPHTGRTHSPVTHWEVLTDGGYRYVRGKDGDEYVFHNGNEVQPESSLLEWMRAGLKRRKEEMEPHSGVSGPETELSRTVERQLSDLGYLD